MKTGTSYAESLARALPITDDELVKLVKVYGFEFCRVLMSCMHIALWTRLDIFTTCVVLAQYQNSPSHIHFKALKQLVGYLRLHPDLPLVFDRSRFIDNVGAFELDIEQFDTAAFNLPGPESYHVANVQLLYPDHHAHACSVASMQTYHPHDTITQVPPNLSNQLCDTLDTNTDIPPRPLTPHIPPDPFIPSTTTDTSFGPESPAPYTESFVDANLPGGIFEKTPYLGFSVCMSGTCIFPFCCKSESATENTTEAEMTAANHLGKALCWLHLYMDDLGLAFDGPVPVAKDNAATRIIAHTGKLTRNVRHIALKTISLQTLVQERIALFRAIGSANNHADHFTKALPLPAHRTHCCQLMGIRFITALHAAAVGRALTPVIK
jgi:hypothetical protein